MTFRLAEGGRIDRARPLRFSFDGRPLAGFAGDTLASALLANGIHLVGRSFKYHRPRGILAAGAEEPNALVEIDRGDGRRTPNLRATQVELFDGLVAVSQNRFPSLRFDFGAAAGLVARLLPAGFYYKTFMWPASFWKHLYEPAIRSAAGLGRAPTAPDPDRYLHRYAHCEVLVIGAGPAGLAAAEAAAATGVRVILCDDQAEPGGSLHDEPQAIIDGAPAAEWIATTTAALAARDNVTLLPRTTAFGWYPDNFIGLAERVTEHQEKPDPGLPRERLWQIRAREVVIATGALERPLVFPDNDRPGIMLAGAARTFLHRHAVLPGRRVVIATACDSAYAAALDLHEAGAGVVAIVDLRAAPDSPVIARARDAGITVRTGAAVTGTTGHLRVTGVRLGADWIGCDALLMSGGWTANVALFSQSRGKLRFDATTSGFLPDTPAARARSVGACAGDFSIADCLGDGHTVTGTIPPAGGSVGLVAGAEPTRAFVDFQNDVTAKDIRLATREGFRSIEHVKRYTTTGMATDQGKTSNLNALAIVADALGTGMPSVGLTSFRPPYTPVTFGTLAGAARGALFEPVRHAPMHEWAASHGAVFEDVGQWKRARYFPRPGEDMHAAVNRECLAVRNAVGMFDASTLGKIEVVGPDAAEFLNRLYINSWTKLGVGRCRYGLMLTEAGFVMDDGVVGRLAEDRFHVTTTTGGAAGVLHHMEDYLQTEFSELRVWLTSTTEHWAVIAVQGPRARDVLLPLVEGIDVAAMPHMSVQCGKICGVAGRLFRVSFTGEFGFEINVPAGHGPAVWDSVLAAGKAHGITPYGTEAMHVLRAEKGFVIVGQETDGTVTPDDLGLAGMIARTKTDFVGRRSLRRPDMMLPNRKQLVGLLTEDAAVVLEEGAQIVADPLEKIPMRMIGHVTSAYWSAALGRSIALGLVEGGRARIGDVLYVPMADLTIAVRVSDPAFHDKPGRRLDG